MGRRAPEQFSLTGSIEIWNRDVQRLTMQSLTHVESVLVELLRRSYFYFSGEVPSHARAKKNRKISKSDETSLELSFRDLRRAAQGSARDVAAVGRIQRRRERRRAAQPRPRRRDGLRSCENAFLAAKTSSTNSIALYDAKHREESILLR